MKLRLQSGRPLTGRVLVRTDHELSVSWEEIGGVLELKAFGAGPEDRFLGVRVMAWGVDPAVAAALEGELAGAVDRLVRSVAVGAPVQGD